MPAMQFPVEHLGFPARDPRALQAWYVRVLGGAILWQDEAVPVYFVRLAGGTVLEICPGQRSVPDTGDNSVAGLRHLALRVDSIDAARGELEHRGVPFTEPVKPAGGGGRVLFFRDPECNLLHLVERPVDTPFPRPAGG
jgi:glyoxylase I family protein